mgnify:CR=1 FL=1
MLTPLHIKILLHYYVTFEPFSPDTETFRSYREFWIASGCLEYEGGDTPYVVTGKGKAWLERVLSTPMPTQKWVWE